MEHPRHACSTSTGATLPFCAGCAEELPWLATPHHLTAPGQPARPHHIACSRCALPLPGIAITPTPDHPPAPILCGHCLRHPPHFDATIALFRYQFPIDRLIQAMKYQHRLDLAAGLGQLLARAVQQHSNHALADTLPPSRIIPLPLHPARLRQRGYNQANELARPLARLLALRRDPFLCLRVRDTPPQASLHHAERQQNVRHAFACQQDLAGQHIVLVDDVMTTGATLDECARTLKNHGAARVTLAILARTPLE